MSYNQYIKKLDLPLDFRPPQEFIFDKFIARPLTREDVKADLEAVNSNVELIKRTRGGSWPEEQLNKEFNLLDLAWHEREFRERSSFAYVVYSTDGIYVGCFYIYPMGHRTILTEDVLKYDADVSWWVTSRAYEEGSYKKLYAALQEWMASFPFQSVFYSNKVIP